MTPIVLCTLMGSVVMAQEDSKDNTDNREKTLFEVYNHKPGVDVRLEAVRQGDQIIFKKTEGDDGVQGNLDERPNTVDHVEPAKPPSASEIAMAVSRRNYTEIENLLASGTPVDSRLYAGLTGLMVASAWSDKKMMDIFVKYNANPKAINLKGETALHLACAYARVDVVKMLTVAIKPEDLNRKSKSGRTCLHYLALYSRDTQKSAYITSLRPDFSVKDENNQNAGHFASVSQNWNMLIPWLKSLDVKEKDKFDMSVEDYMLSKSDLLSKYKLYPYLTPASQQLIKENLKNIRSVSEIIE